MTSHQELREQLAVLMDQRPELFDATKRVRTEHDREPDPHTVPSGHRGEHETRQLVLDALRENPKARSALLANRQKNLERQTKAPATPRPTQAVCPYCHAPGEPREIRSATASWTVTWRRSDCCPDALLEHAERALRYASNQDGEQGERTDNARRYLALRGQITRERDLVALDRLEADLKARASYRGPSYARQGGES